MEQHDRPDQGPQQRQGAHADPPAEQPRRAARAADAGPSAVDVDVAAGSPARLGHGATSRSRLRSTTTSGASVLCQSVTGGLEVAGAVVARRVRGDPVEGRVEVRELVVEAGVGVVAHAGSVEASPRPRDRPTGSPSTSSVTGTRSPSASTRTMSARQVLDSGNIWNANSL